MNRQTDELSNTKNRSKNNLLRTGGDAQ